MKTRLPVLVILYAWFLSFSTVLGGSLIRRSLKQLMWETKDLLKLCASRNDSRWECLKEESLVAVENFANSEKIPLFIGVSLVRVKDNDNLQVDASGENGNGTYPASTYSNGEEQTNKAAEENQSPDASHMWTTRVLNALDHMFQTHVLQIDLLSSIEGKKKQTKRTKDSWLRQYYWKLDNQSIVEGRHRRHRQQMVPMMIFGVTVFGMIVVPIGFQFLAALSGKAFLMAKLALLLASINGLKRVAPSGVHYGLYHSMDRHQLHHSGPPGMFYDHDSAYGPRNMPPID